MNDIYHNEVTGRYVLSLHHDTAVALAAALGRGKNGAVVYDVFDKLTDLFPGDIDYPPYRALVDGVDAE